MGGTAGILCCQRGNSARLASSFTYVRAWCGIVYVAFVVDVHSRAIVGWSASANKRATLVLDPRDMALWRRNAMSRASSTRPAR
ncbi:hypothetical protein [Microtetraspora malaysiensis]|uniref:hypothetical protein n=1 Tax=Microtetraspora malaysiensis TaxID=161358 RepID=UPI003D903707